MADSSNVADRHIASGRMLDVSPVYLIPFLYLGVLLMKCLAIILVLLLTAASADAFCGRGAERRMDRQERRIERQVVRSGGFFSSFKAAGCTVAGCPIR